MLEYILSKFPLSSSAFLLYALIGAGMLIAGTLEYGSYSTNLLAVGLACGAIGVPRAVTKASQGIKSMNFLGIIESIPIPTVVFIVFAGASTVALATVSITFGAFTENLTKVGIACGAVQAARGIESILAVFLHQPDPNPTGLSGKVDPPPPPAPSA